MRRWSIWFVPVVLVAAIGGSRRASARCPRSVKKKILRLNKTAMEDYDLLEFESARQSLLDAERLARVNDCDDDPVMAKTYTNLAVLYIQGFKDEDRGKLMFRRALRISRSIKLDPQVATPKLVRIFNEVRRQVGAPEQPEEGGEARPAPRPRPPEPEKPAKGLEHTPIEEAPRGRDLKVTCRVGDDLGANRVILFYKTQNMLQYQAVPMTKKTQWTWEAAIPAAHMTGRSVYYYIEARRGEKPLAASGNAASPYIIALTEPKAGTSEDTENPLAAGGQKKRKRKKGPTGPKGKIGIFVALGGGLHVGYIGDWYGDLSNEKPSSPGFGLGTLDGRLEGGYFITPSMLVSLAFSLGYAFSDKSQQPIIGWQVLARFRYVVVGQKSSVFRLYVGAELGGGVVYHSLQLRGGKDTFESGPGLLLGGIFGMWIGNETVGWYLEVDPKGVIDFTKKDVTVEGASVPHPQQHTFTLGVATGVALKF